MHRIDRVLIVAGPTAAGKSTFVKELTAGRLEPLQTRVGIPNLQEWPWLTMGSLVRRADVQLKEAILHYDFLWIYPSFDGQTPAAEKSLAAILNESREVSIVTLWTPPATLERHLIEGKLRVRLQANRVQGLKALIFRRLPRLAIRGLAKFPCLNSISRSLPGHAFLHHLLVLRIYSRPDEVVAMYRRWLQFCDRQISKTRAHVIVEFDKELKFYSRDEWENRIRIYEGG
jgi:hypothetical protein